MIKLFVLGDSISIHYGPYLEELSKGKFLYSRKTGKEPEWVEVDKSDMGDNGGNSWLVLQYLNTMKDIIRPEIFLVNCGLHDIRMVSGADKAPVSIEEYAENLQKIIQLGREIAKHLIWVTTTDFDEKRHNSYDTGYARYEKDNLAYHQKALEVMAENKVSVIDLRGFTETLGGNIFVDHVHFTEEVRKKQAGFIFNELEKLGY